MRAGDDSGGELMSFAAERIPGVGIVGLGRQTREPDSFVTLDVIRVDNEAERGGKDEGASSDGAERQGDNRGDRGNNCGSRERVHNSRRVDCCGQFATDRKNPVWAGRNRAERPIAARAVKAEPRLYFPGVDPHDFRR